MLGDILTICKEFHMHAFRVKKAIAKKEETTQMLRQQMLVSRKGHVLIHTLLDKSAITLRQRPLIFFNIFIVDFEQGFALRSFPFSPSTTKNKGSTFVVFLNVCQNINLGILKCHENIWAEPF